MVGRGGVGGSEREKRFPPGSEGEIPRFHQRQRERGRECTRGDEGEVGQEGGGLGVQRSITSFSIDMQCSDSSVSTHSCPMVQRWPGTQSSAVVLR